MRYFEKELICQDKFFECLKLCHYFVPPGGRTQHSSDLFPEDLEMKMQK